MNKAISLIRLSLLIPLLFTSLIWASDTEPSFVQITVSTARVYEDMRPDAIVITRAYRGDIYNIVELRDTWVQISTPRGNGWLYRSDCKTLLTRDEARGGAPQTLYFVIILILALTGAVIIFFKQQQKEEPFL